MTPTSLPDADHGHRPEPTSEQFWDRQYRGEDPDGPLPTPNATFVQALTDLAPEPGHALEVACGRGGDTLWLARQGWRVTAVDVSGTVLTALAERARRARLSDHVTTRRHDLSLSTPRPHPEHGPWDLLYAGFFHPTTTGVDRYEALRRVADGVATGGHLVVLDHASSAPWSWQRRDDFPDPEETWRSLGLSSNWRPVQLERRVRTAIGPTGEHADVVDNLVIARRDPS